MADLVIDASVASARCFPDERMDYTNGVLQAVSSSLESFAPRLWAYEIRNSVLMGLRRGRISRTDAEEFLDSLDDLNIRLTDPVSYEAVFELAETNGLTVYDAAYLDLAIREGAQLASLDNDFQFRVEVDRHALGLKISQIVVNHEAKARRSHRP